MPELQGQPGELKLTLQITRAATGQTEEVEMVGFVDDAEFQQFLAQQQPPEQE